MLVTDKYLLSLIWGLLFMILSLPVFAAGQDSIMIAAPNPQEKINTSISPMIFRM